MRKKNLLAYSAIVFIAVAMVLIIWYIFSRPEDKEAGSVGDKIGEKIGSVVGNKCLGWGDDSLPLKRGSCGDRVEAFQEHVNARIGAGTIGVDGKFGETTETWAERLTGKKQVNETYFRRFIRG